MRLLRRRGRTPLMRTFPFCRLASARPERYAPATVYPCDALPAPSPLTLYASSVLDAQSRVHPSNERCLCRSPGGRTATLSDWLWFASTRRLRYDAPSIFVVLSFHLPARLIRLRPLASRDGGRLNSRSIANLFLALLRASRHAPRIATARPRASVPAPRCQLSALAYCLRRSASRTIGSARCPAANATRSRPIPPSSNAHGDCPTC
jgi:hypothetical protein